MFDSIKPSVVHDAAGSFFYFKWSDLYLTEKPYVMFVDVPEGFPTTNYESEQGPRERVKNIRGSEGKFSLDSHGFAVRNHVLNMNATDENTVERIYLPSFEKLLKDEVGSDCIVLWFDWRIRTSDSSKTSLPPGTKVKLDDKSLPLAPIRSAHVDHTEEAVWDRVGRLTGTTSEQLPMGRVRVINVWRPLRNVVEEFPLAVCDGSSVPDDKLVEIDVVRQSYAGGIYNLLPYDGYRWYFLDKQTSDELLVMKMYDSSTDVEAKICPHASFRLGSNVPELHRESFEARALVFSER